MPPMNGGIFTAEQGLITLQLKELVVSYFEPILLFYIQIPA